MYLPVLVVPPAEFPVSLERAKLHCRVDGADEDELIEGLIGAAVSHLDGYTGILGRCLMEQTWRQDFDRFTPCMRLPLPASSLVSVTYRNAAGQVSTIADANYALKGDALGSYVRFDAGFSFPSGLYEAGAVTVNFKAGATAASDVPKAICQAILLMVGHWYANREDVVTGTIATKLPLAVDALLAPWRRVGL